MATFLTTEKMSPELAARIEASVKGKGSRARGRRAPGATAVLRLALLGGVVLVGITLLTSYQKSQDDFETARLELLSDYQRAGQLEGDGQVVDTARRLLEQAASGTHEEFAAPSLRNGDQLRALLDRPTLFVRGPMGYFTRPATAGPDQRADTFISCLRRPPASAREVDMLHHVDQAHQKAAEGTLANTGSEISSAGEGTLSAIDEARRFLASSWEREVREASTMGQLRRLRSALDHAGLPSASAASRAELLVYLIDESTQPGATVEFDGASPHHVRVGILDLTTTKVLLRRRLPVDPSWISEKRRVYFARGLNTCRLALDVAASLSAPN